MKINANVIRLNLILTVFVITAFLANHSSAKEPNYYEHHSALGPHLTKLQDNCHRFIGRPPWCSAYKLILRQLYLQDYVAAYGEARKLISLINNKHSENSELFRDALKLTSYIALIGGHYSSALAHSERANNPDLETDEGAKIVLAETYLELGRIGEFEKLINCKKYLKQLSNQHIHVSRFLFLCAEFEKRTGNYFWAQKFLIQAIKTKDSSVMEKRLRNPFVLSSLALMHIKRGNLLEASNILTRAENDLNADKDLFSHSAITLRSVVQIGEAYFNLKNYERASVNLKAAIRMSDRGYFNNSNFYRAYAKLLLGKSTDKTTSATSSINYYRKLRGELVSQPFLYISVFLEQIKIEKSLQLYSEARRHLKRVAYYIKERFSTRNIIYAKYLTEHAHLHQLTGDYGKALDLMRKSRDILTDPLLITDENSRSYIFPTIGNFRSNRFHADIALSPQQKRPRAKMEAEAFEVIQLAHPSETSGDIKRMAARFAIKSSAISINIRELQDIRSQLQIMNQKFISLVTSNYVQKIQIQKSKIETQINTMSNRFTLLSKRIQDKFPNYTALVSPKPLSMERTKALLKPTEALITFSPTYSGDRTHVFVVRDNSQKIYTVEVGSEELNDLVRRVRLGITVSNNIPRKFDIGASQKLFSYLIGPAENFLKGTKHIFFIPRGPLISIPFSILAMGDNGRTGEIEEIGTTRGLGYSNSIKKTKKKASEFSSVPWIINRYALSTLPSIASFNSLRSLTEKAYTQRPFIGFGDPNLLGDPVKCRMRNFDTAELLRGDIANVNKLRKLCPLPSTSSELNQIAKYLKADKKTSLYLQDKATEKIVKKLKLNNTRVIAFATHGLLSRETQEIGHAGEPALVLTPPRNPTKEDDGLLTSSEIALLKLNADFVILSACNTAAGQHENAEGLSGLAKAFFYAGARSLLVSHWPVESNAATELTTVLFKNMSENPNISRAEAFRQSMLSMVANEKKSHPFYWAPFSIIGDGR